MKATTICTSLLFIAMTGCGDTSPPTPKMSPEETVRNCIANSPGRLRTAIQDGTIVEVSKDIVATLDNHEDSIHGELSAPFEQFHLEVDQFQRLAATGQEDDVAKQLAKVSQLAADYLAVARQ